MVKFRDVSAAEAAEWDQWVADLPDCCRFLGEKFNPWTLYRLKTTDQRVTIEAIAENGTLRVNVLARFNPALLFERSVFGIKPDDLEECDLPTGFILGEPFLSQDEVEENRDALRLLIRPDLFKAGVNGKAVRRDGSGE